MEVGAYDRVERFVQRLPARNPPFGREHGRSSQQPIFLPCRVPAQPRIRDPEKEPMKYRPLANTGVFVSELCLGAMTFGSQWEVIGALSQKDADALVHRSLDEGINFFDTADVYSSGESEEILGRSLKGRRRDAVIATKVRGRMVRVRTMSGSRGCTSCGPPKRV